MRVSFDFSTVFRLIFAADRGPAGASIVSGIIELSSAAAVIAGASCESLVLVIRSTDLCAGPAAFAQT